MYIHENFFFYLFLNFVFFLIVFFFIIAVPATTSSGEWRSRSDRNSRTILIVERLAGGLPGLHRRRQSFKSRGLGEAVCTRWPRSGRVEIWRP